MTEFKIRRCHECGLGRVRLVALPGRTARYKNMPSLPIPAELEIPTCDNCGAEWLDEETASKIDNALDTVYRAELRRRVHQAIEQLTVHTSQRKLEALLGLSQGYLSKLRAGERDPSPELVSDLALLARDPATRLRELEEYWASSHSSTDHAA